MPRYIDRHGQKFLVKSKNLWPKTTPAVEHLKAKVWVEVCHHDPDWAGATDLR